MNLKELKKMIAEEYSSYLAEQDDPEVAVSDADVDADGTAGDEDAEGTLRDIYDMLKDYFEGGEADTTTVDSMPTDDAADDAEAEEADDAEEEADEKLDETFALQERFKKLANIIKG